MRKLIFCLFLIIPLFIFAQDKNQYLTGGIPMENGKIIFRSDISVPNMSKNELYDLALNWAKNRYKPTEKMNANVVFEDSNAGTFAVRGEEYLVFSNMTFSLDRTRIYYILTVSCKDGEVDVDMQRINYWYDESRNGGEKYKAEDWISDKMALNKSKTKLSPITGKFRRKTIDLKNDLFKQISDLYINSNTNKSVNNNQNNIQSSVKENSIKESSTFSEEEKISRSARMSISSVNGEKIELSKESWGGFGDILGKRVAFLIIDKSKSVTNMLLNDSEKYSISFYGSSNSTPSVTITCKKLMRKEMDKDELMKFNLPNKENNSFYLYIGEIIK